MCLSFFAIEISGRANAPLANSSSAAMKDFLIVDPASSRTNASPFLNLSATVPYKVLKSDRKKKGKLCIEITTSCRCKQTNANKEMEEKRWSETQEQALYQSSLPLEAA